MTSCDANVLLYCFSEASPFHARARRFLEGLTERDDVAVSELVLVEFYTLLRNPAVLVNPLGAAAAVEVVQTYRRHPRWMLLGFDPDSLALHDELWPRVAEPAFGRRRNLRRPPGAFAAPAGRHRFRHGQREGLQRLRIRPGLESGGLSPPDGCRPAHDAAVPGPRPATSARRAPDGCRPAHDAAVESPGWPPPSASSPSASQATISQPWKTTATPTYRTGWRRRPSSAR